MSRLCSVTVGRPAPGQSGAGNMSVLCAFFCSCRMCKHRASPGESRCKDCLLCSKEVGGGESYTNQCAVGELKGCEQIRTFILQLNRFLCLHNGAKI